MKKLLLVLLSALMTIQTPLSSGPKKGKKNKGKTNKRDRQRSKNQNGTRSSLTASTIVSPITPIKESENKETKGQLLEKIINECIEKINNLKSEVSKNKENKIISEEVFKNITHNLNALIDQLKYKESSWLENFKTIKTEIEKEAKSLEHDKDQLISTITALREKVNTLIKDRNNVEETKKLSTEINTHENNLKNIHYRIKIIKSLKVFIEEKNNQINNFDYNIKKENEKNQKKTAYYEQKTEKMKKLEHSAKFEADFLKNSELTPEEKQKRLEVLELKLKVAEKEDNNIEKNYIEKQIREIKRKTNNPKDDLMILSKEILNAENKILNATEKLEREKEKLLYKEKLKEDIENIEKINYNLLSLKEKKDLLNIIFNKIINNENQSEADRTEKEYLAAIKKNQSLTKKNITNLSQLYTLLLLESISKEITDPKDASKKIERAIISNLKQIETAQEKDIILEKLKDILREANKIDQASEITKTFGQLIEKLNNYDIAASQDTKNKFHRELYNIIKTIKIENLRKFIDHTANEEFQDARLFIEDTKPTARFSWLNPLTWLSKK